MAHISPLRAHARTRSPIYKLIASLLLASFLLPASVLAQVADQAASSSTNDSGTTTTEQPSDSLLDQLTDFLTKGGGNKGEPGDGGGTASALSGGDSGSFYRPSDGSLIQGYNFRSGTDPYTGAFTHKFDLTLPPGRNGMTPALTLTYNNQDTRNDSPFGYGWSITIPSIERFNRHGIDTLYSTSTFASSEVGELLPTAVGTTTSFSAKSDDGRFFTFTLQNNVWTAKDKNGTVYLYGTTTGARQDDAANTTRVYKWMLESVTDTNGNKITYSYYKSQGQIYPSTVNYTGNGAESGIFEVAFLRENRTDTTTSYKSGFLATTSERISEIQAKVNGSWVRKYALGYTTGNNGYRSLLASITETGKDESGATITLPATEFSYTQNPGGWAQGTTWYEPYDTLAVKYPKFADVNGDGYTDVLVSYGQFDSPPTNVIQETKINNTTSGWTASSTLAPPIHFTKKEFESCSHGTYTVNDMGAVLPDVNGDIFPDIIQKVGGYGSSYLNNQGASWTSTSAFIPPADLSWRCSGQANSVGDVNGDGFPDVVNMDSDLAYVWYGTGTGFGATSTRPGPIYVDPGWKDILGDINGDGLDDSMRAYQQLTPSGAYGSYTSINTGTTTWVSSSAYASPIVFYYTNGTDNQVRLIDINADGLLDLVSLANAGTKLNTGNGWSASSIFAPPFEYSNTNYYSDVNGDGLIDIFAHHSSIQAIKMNTGRVPDLLSQVIAPAGGKTNIVYKASTQYRDGSNNILNPKLPFIVQTASEIGVTDPVLGTVGTTTYTYADGSFYYNSAFDRQYAGFGKVTKTDPTGATTTTFYHQGNTTNSSQGEFSDHISKAGKPYRIEQADSSGNIYTKTMNKWDRYDQGNGRNFVKLAQTLTQNYDGDSDHKDKGEAYTWSNTNGNLTQKIEYGEVTGSDDGTFTDTGTDKFTTDISYASGSGITGLPSTETTNNQSSSKVKETRHYYDGQSLDSVTKGNETKTEGWKSSSSYASTTKTYDATYGLVTQEKDGKGNATNHTYDSYNLFVSTSTNPLSQTRNFKYDYSSGKVATTTDENSRVFVNVYDALDRVKEEKQPDIATPTTLVSKALYTYTDTQNAKSVKKESFLNSATSTDEYTYLDGLDRVIQKRKEAEDANTFAVSDFAYNTRGLLDKESLPYFSTGSARTSPTGTSALYTTYSYDPLQRITTVARVAGNETRAYDDWKTTITDPRSNQKSLYADAHGNLIKVDEVNDGSTYTTNYEYDYLKDLTKITDADSNVRNFTYDGLGRRLTAQDLHASGDGTYGTYTYTYDDAGNMTQKVDPKSQTVNYTYDALNRPLTEDYTGAGGTEVTYAYDSGTDGKTRLTQAVMTGSATTTYAYNPLGLTKTETKAITGGGTYTTTYDYDRQGNQTKITYPDNAEVQYTYNTAGQLETVIKKESGGSFTDVVTDFDYAPMGQVSYTANANGTETTNTYDPAELYRLKTKFTKLSSCGACGGEEAPEGWMPPEFQVLAEQVTAPLMEFLSAPEVTAEEVPSVDVAAQVSTSTPVIEEPATSTPVVTEATSTPTLASEISTTEGQDKGLTTDGLIRNADDARAWRKYHKERVEYLKTQDLPPQVLEAALHGQEKFESYLFKKGYVKSEGGEVVTPVLSRLMNGIKKFFSWFLPQEVYAYVFGKEDFESCSSLPCSFTSNAAWGSVTASLDTGSQVQGTKSLKDVVSGEGGGGMKKTGLSTGEIWVQFKIKVPSPVTYGASGYFSILTLQDSSSNARVWMNVEDYGTPRLTIAGNVLGYTNTGLDLTAGAVNTVEMRVKTGTSKGYCPELSVNIG